MQLSLARTSRIPRWPLGAVACGLAWLALAALVQWMGRIGGSAPVLCPFKRMTALPCPTCGTTRAVLNLLAGDVAAAVACNPLTCLAAIALGVLLIAQVVTGRRLELNLTRRQRRWAWALAVAAGLANWAYVIRVGM